MSSMRRAPLASPLRSIHVAHDSSLLSPLPLKTEIPSPSSSLYRVLSSLSLLLSSSPLLCSTTATPLQTPSPFLFFPTNRTAPHFFSSSPFFPCSATKNQPTPFLYTTTLPTSSTPLCCPTTPATSPLRLQEAAATPHSTPATLSSTSSSFPTVSPAAAILTPPYTTTPTPSPNSAPALCFPNTTACPYVSPLFSKPSSLLFLHSLKQQQLPLPLSFTNSNQNNHLPSINSSNTKTSSRPTFLSSKTHNSKPPHHKQPFKHPFLHFPSFNCINSIQTSSSSAANSS